MAAEDELDAQDRWQQNPWVWLIIAIPALTIAGCLMTIYLALTRPDYLVRDYTDAPPVLEPAPGEPAS